MKKIIGLLFIVTMFISCGYYPNEDYNFDSITTELINSYQSGNITDGFGYVELFFNINNESNSYITYCSIIISITCIDNSVYTYNTIIYSIPVDYSSENYITINTEFKKYSSIEINIIELKLDGLLIKKQ
jgi:hypothetical protein